MAPAVRVVVEVRADAGPAAAVGQGVVFTLIPLADLVVERVEDKPLLRADAVVELVDQDRHVGRLANRLRPEDGDVARVERDRRVGQVAVTAGAEPQVGRPAAVGAVERRRQDHPVEVAAEPPAAVVPGVDPPGAPQRRNAHHPSSAIQRPRPDRVLDHPRPSLLQEWSSHRRCISRAANRSKQYGQRTRRNGSSRVNKSRGICAPAEA